MRVLHVAAMPFPSPQGTQAAVASIVAAHAAAGHETHLATYARGDGTAVRDGVAVHRIPDVPRDRSLRSGPSARKLALDASLAVLVARLARTLRPDLVVAHHVEAALASFVARARPLVFVAHTTLGAELPAYVVPSLAPVVRAAGDSLDRLLVRRADVALAVAPALARRLTQLAGRRVDPLPLPWPPAPLLTHTRDDARRSLGLAPTDDVLLYAGNLDVYQGVDVLLEAARRVASRRPHTRLLVATESDARALAVASMPALVLARLANEDDRARAHAAADVALVPRALPGGVPVKLLDALARGVPVVAARRATGGLALGDAAVVVADDDAGALADAAVSLLGDPASRAALRAAGPAYVEGAHSAARFVDALARATAR